MDEDVALAAKEKLEAAIGEYYRTVEPDVFLNGYVLVTHKETIEHHRNNMSGVAYLTPTGQSWPHTIGYLIAASDSARGIAQ